MPVNTYVCDTGVYIICSDLLSTLRKPWVKTCSQHSTHNGQTLFQDSGFGFKILTDTTTFKQTKVILCSEFKSHTSFYRPQSVCICTYIYIYIHIYTCSSTFLLYNISMMVLGGGLALNTHIYIYIYIHIYIYMFLDLFVIQHFHSGLRGRPGSEYTYIHIHIHKYIHIPVLQLFCCTTFP